MESVYQEPSPPLPLLPFRVGKFVSPNPRSCRRLDFAGGRHSVTVSSAGLTFGLPRRWYPTKGPARGLIRQGLGQERGVRIHLLPPAIWWRGVWGRRRAGG